MKFEKPVVEIEKFEVVDILTASATEDPRADAIAPPYVDGPCSGNMSDYGMGEGCVG